jgi:hypothetical protein
MAQKMTREEKIEFLSGLQNGTRSIIELDRPDVLILKLSNDKPDVVMVNNKSMTPERAQALVDTKHPDTIVWKEIRTYDGGTDWWKQEKYAGLGIFFRDNNQPS